MSDQSPNQLLANLLVKNLFKKHHVENGDLQYSLSDAEKENLKIMFNGFQAELDKLTREHQKMLDDVLKEKK